VAYAAIALEHPIKINKGASALLGAGLLWTVYATLSGDHALVGQQLNESVASTAQIVSFLIGAMTIVEVIDAHNGFEVITSQIRTTKQITLMWIVCFVTFFLSAVLDNLTTTIVMISLMKNFREIERACGRPRARTSSPSAGRQASAARCYVSGGWRRCGQSVVAGWRGNSGHLHRPWRAICVRLQDGDLTFGAIMCVDPASDPTHLTLRITIGKLGDETGESTSHSCASLQRDTGSRRDRAMLQSSPECRCVVRV
jgi:hypothetical protein